MQTTTGARQGICIFSLKGIFVGPLDTSSNISLWKKLRRKRAAMFSLYVIGFACLVAIFAYPLSSDNSPNANRMLVELGARPPGFSCLFLKRPRHLPGQEKPTLTRLFTGTPQQYDLIPVTSFFFVKDTLVVSHYVDEGISDTMTFSIKALLPQPKWRLDPGHRQLYILRRNITRHTFFLGTDRYGRDVLSRLLIGTRVSLSVGIVAVALSLSIGILLGALAGYYRGWVDNAVMYLINMLWAIPTLLLVFAITLSIGKGFWQIFIAIGLTMWVSAARLIRGQVLVLRELEYIQAAKTLGLSDMRIIARHILPNIAGPLMVIAASNFAAAILIEAGLSFLGIGVQPPMPSWGLMIKEHFNFLVTNRPVLALIPGAAIMILVYAFNVLGNALRDVLDVRGSN
jgi:peptide/nickel transport system permease protein